MKTSLLTLTASFALTLALSLSLASCAEAGSSEPVQKEAVEQIVHNYLMENPEVIRDALVALEKKEMAQIIKTLRQDPRDPSIGPNDAKVTIIEFFDYNCGYCKRATPWIKEAIETHGADIRVIFKELPVLDKHTKTSRLAAKAAFAANRQGQYEPMHFALMEQSRLSAKSIRKTAEELDLDMAKFDKDMSNPELDEHIDDIFSQASLLPELTGTPYFLVNETEISGADMEKLDAALKAALKG